jgi:hypothetical protein
MDERTSVAWQQWCRPKPQSITRIPIYLYSLLFFCPGSLQNKPMQMNLGLSHAIDFDPLDTPDTPATRPAVSDLSTHMEFLQHTIWLLMSFNVFFVTVLMYSVS